MHFFKSITAALASTVCLYAPAASAETLKAPLLGIDSGFFLVPSTPVLERLIDLGINDLRDNTVWKWIETEKGEYNFDAEQQRGVDALNRAGLAGSLIIWADNPLYEDGNTVTTPSGIKALAKFVSAYLDHYPNIRSLEIGNEFNSSSFIYGPIKEFSSKQLAEVQYNYLKALDKFENIHNMRVIGASAHSIAAGYIWALLDLGGAEFMDAISIHTYTTEPEHIPAEMNVLRRHPAMADMEIEVTEFGQQDHALAPDFFWRNYCTMSQAGIERAVWYPLKQRGDGYPPVLQEDLSLSPLGQALAFAHKEVQGVPVEAFKPDPFTYGCVFNGKDAVIWGEPRGFQVNRSDIALRRGDLRPFDRDQELSRDRVVLLHTDGAPIDLGSDISFCPQPVVADSYHEFYRPEEGENARTAPGVEGFRRYLLVGDESRIVDLVTCPGQQRNGVPWRPYLCSAEEEFWQFSMMPASFNIVGSAEDNMRVVYDYESEREQLLYVDTEVSPNLLNAGGVTLDILIDGEKKVSEVVEGKQSNRYGPFAAPLGADVQVMFGPTAMPQVYLGDFRVTLRNPTCACDFDVCELEGEPRINGAPEPEQAAATTE
ncbi:hypothetical protein [Donghicola mangrovi]|uniref:Asl1-like glycosyl hydrolase catalytic domain-containing protein n=1 Tax=Donghicola mangrovi TaxID=2729614 RepID=A0A850Q640_9RHOB|nr:hypothetical protein [Donghicola mangrovi]NVO25207.1 hypothetical protein [Donghicola mangrovi]